MAAAIGGGLCIISDAPPTATFRFRFRVNCRPGVTRRVGFRPAVGLYYGRGWCDAAMVGPRAGPAADALRRRLATGITGRRFCRPYRTEPIGTPGRFTITAAGGAGRRCALDGRGGNRRLAGAAAEFGRRAGIPTGPGGRRVGPAPGNRDGNAAAGGGVFAVRAGAGFYIGLSFWYGGLRLISGVRFRFCQVSVVSGEVKWVG